MKLSVSSYSFGHYRSDNELGILGCMEKAAELGFDGFEIVPGNWSADDDIVRDIRSKAAELGLELPALAVGADFINGSNGDTKAEIERVKKQVDLAAALGVKLMRHDVTGGFRNVNRKYALGYDDALKIIAPAIYEVAAYAEQKGIGTMTENHGFFSQDSCRVEKLINTVAHPNFAVLIDLGNFLCADEEPTLAVARLAPYAVHVHAKDFFVKSGMDQDPGSGWFRSRAGNYLRGTIIGHGDAHIYQSINTLKRAGYDGYLSIEFEGIEDNITGISIGRDNLLNYLK